MSNYRNLLAIDPGLSGGFALKFPEGGVVSHKMPPTIQELYELLDSVAKPAVVLMERVGKHKLGNSAQSSATFAKHVGHLEMALIALGLPTATVTATAWMNEIAPLRPKGMEPNMVRARKNHIKDLMQRRYPEQKVIHATADAFGILTYLIRNQDKY